MSGSISIPIWAIGLVACIGGLTWLILTHGRKPFAVDQKPFDRLMEVVGKPYVLIVIMAAAALLIAAYVFYLNDIVVSVHHMVKSLRPESQAKEINSDTLRNLAQGSALLLGALVAASTLIFTLIRVWINERTTTATEEGLITDRINAAVASLGAEKTIKKDGIEETVPNIEVRMGAILALERIAKKNADVHIQIMEILTGYLRENAPLAKDVESLPDRQKPRQDIQLALTVIGRRPAKRIALETANKFRLDLRNCEFSLVDLTGLNFDNARLSNSHFLKANLRHAQLNNADLEDAQLNNAYLSDAQLNNADLWYAQLNNADLGDAQLNNAFLMDAQLNHADLEDAQLNNAYLSSAQLNNAFLRHAQLNHADLMHAQLNDAGLEDAQLNNADLMDAELEGVKFLTRALMRGACVRNLDLSTIEVSQKQIDTMFGDVSVTLPASLTRPAHWPKEELERRDFHDQWRAWLKTLPPADND